MINIILDTDIGCDCDDAGALAVLHNLENLGECRIKAMTSSSSRIDGAACIDAINKYYNKAIPVGMNLKKGFLDQQPYGIYSFEVSKQYDNDFKESEAPCAIKIMRETLVNSEAKSVKLVVIGPCNNLANLLISQPDEIINKSGVELINEKVSEVVVMGGYFPKEGQITYLGNELMRAEWNILQDIKSAQLSASLCPVEMVFCPFEVGLVKTGSKLFENECKSPVKLSYEIHSKGIRESWDPITCYYAVRGCHELWSISDMGTISILDNGETVFKKDSNGKHRYLINKDNEELVKLEIDHLIK